MKKVYYVYEDKRIEGSTNWDIESRYDVLINKYSSYEEAIASIRNWSNSIEDCISKNRTSSTETISQYNRYLLFPKNGRIITRRKIITLPLKSS